METPTLRIDHPARWVQQLVVRRILTPLILSAPLLGCLSPVAMQSEDQRSAARQEAQITAFYDSHQRFALAQSQGDLHGMLEAAMARDALVRKSDPRRLVDAKTRELIEYARRFQRPSLEQAAQIESLLAEQPTTRQRFDRRGVGVTTGLSREFRLTPGQVREFPWPINSAIPAIAYLEHGAGRTVILELEDEAENRLCTDQNLWGFALCRWSAAAAQEWRQQRARTLYLMVTNQSATTVDVVLMRNQ